MSGTPVVSVAMLTFNHASFVTQAVESALAQQTDFGVELVIGDDCSTDGTRTILEQLQRRAGGCIRLIGGDQRVGVNRNLVNTLQACQGRYVALLEGDDFWIGEEKLQRQVEFLEQHSECSAVHHNVYVQTDADVGSRVVMRQTPLGQLRLPEVLRGNPVSTCSILFRNGLRTGYPDWFLRVPTPDWALHVLNAQHGELGYLDQVWAVYRLHSASYWSSRTQLNQLTGLIETATLMEACLDVKMRKHLESTIRRLREDVLEEFVRDGCPTEASDYSARFFSDAAALRRLTRFYEALQQERAGCKIAAITALLSALVTAPTRTRIRTRDILLALFRVASPQVVYQSARSLWRRAMPELKTAAPAEPTDPIPRSSEDGPPCG